MLTLETTPSVATYYDEWKRLWHTEQAGPFLHPAWHAAFVEASGTALDPLIICVHRDGTLVGLIPMRRDPGGVMRFLTAPRSDYEDALVSQEGRDEILSILAHYLLDRRFELAEMPQGSPLADMLKNRGITPQQATPCPAIRLTPESFGDVTGRKSLKRHQKKLSRHGDVSLESVAVENLELALNRFMDQHVARWIAVGEDSLFLAPLNRAFYRNLVSHPDFREYGTFHVLKAGTSNAAYHVGLTNGTSFIWYKPTFDMNLESDGPGEVLLKKLLEYAFANDAGFFDFSRGNEPFKLRFANVQRSNLRFTHRLPLSQVALHGIRRRWQGLGRRCRLLASRLVIRGSCRLPVRWIEISAPKRIPETPQGYDAEFGEADLTSFGGLRLHCPHYVTTERMRSAIERRKRGDRLVTVRRSSDGMPVHFSWCRIDSQSPSAAPGEDLSQPDEPSGAIFDSWTASSEPENIHAWSVHFAAWHAAQLISPIYVESGVENRVHLVLCSTTPKRHSQ